jgi:CHASE1-domain containing sensor protein
LIHPLEGNEGAVGHDLLNTNRREDCLNSIRNNKLFFSGPLTLIQNNK